MTWVNVTDWSPAGGHIVTRWAQDVSPDEVWPEYPRPQMVRGDWLNLNGLWEYTVLPREQGWVLDYEGQILVPFPIESALSGVAQPLLPDQRLWYRRTFTVPESWRGQLVLLHFGAVDWEATVWVNRQRLGRHQGGFDPFTFEISGYLKEEGENELVVAVWDPTDEGTQSRGKQVLDPGHIWYTAVSGIWQTVWLEPVSDPHISRLRMTPDLDAGTLALMVHTTGSTREVGVRAVALDGGSEIAAASGVPEEVLTLPIPEPKLWSPETPYLYDLQVQLTRNGQGLDRVDSYFAMRKFSVAPDQRGIPRLCLNNEPLFHFGPLDQGYWPDGLYTPPSDEALRYDLEFCKRLGFNTIRKHVKLEPARYYHHCDRLGLIVWQDMPNGGKSTGRARSSLTRRFGLTLRDDRRYGRFGRDDPESREQFLRELRAMIDALGNAPCIGMWVPFNEGWGQFDAGKVADWVRAQDPSRPVDHASGWYDQGVGDFHSLHVYARPLTPPKAGAKRGSDEAPARATILSEFGGYSLQVNGHVLDPKGEFGYRKFKTSEELTDAYIALLKQELKPWIAEGLSGAVYTQTTDVEIEVNGYLTYDREVVKMDADRIGAVHRSLYE